VRRELKERDFAIMDEPQQYAWQQQPRETDKAYQAFVVYRNLDPKERSLSRVVSELAKSRTLLSRVVRSVELGRARQGVG
jgi:hypothetical protein